MSDPRDSDPRAVQAMDELQQALGSGDAARTAKAIDRVVKLRINQFIDGIAEDARARGLNIPRT